MKKKLFLITLVILTLLVVSTNRSFAWPTGFDAIYMVGSNGSTVEKDVFDINDPSPWLYLDTTSAPAYNIAISFYTSPTGDDYWTYEINNPTDKIWISLDDGYSGIPFISATPIDWAGIKELGLWNVTAKYAGCGSNCTLNVGSTSFSVVPEPVSSVLFLVGGTLIVGRRYLKKRKIS